ncbi:ABC transporter ATP-binding protein [Desulfofundulus sp. TPOSR]|uniref:ABC transporter ATP-binding protein n=1 Tax=Desulfofundulus sp. TPOSR TaxID=2714340 RepID=UPI00140AC697|nr:ABC transporter ATP-binding protein [Desulfofundulus sp. TPOSR]NHM26644.1 ABC transporter ATP-binding protein [Desulfofundulus sp. TPOSR]
MKNGTGHYLLIDGVSKTFPGQFGRERLKVLDEINLYADEGEIIGIVGPSGCGKSTLLNIIAGFVPPDRGRVVFCGKHVQKPSPERAVVFQTVVLFPWLTVWDNISYGLKRRGEKNIARLVKRYIQIVGLDSFEYYYPDQLSGGMQQRVALARVLVLNSRLLLMDEPFASLDALSRLTMQQLLLDIWQKLRITVLFVTHDVEEALLLTHRIYIMSRRPGRIIQEIQVPFGFPRSFSLTGTPCFAQLKSKILSTLIGLK